jgi:hypothetical protein
LIALEVAPVELPPSFSGAPWLLIEMRVLVAVYGSASVESFWQTM